MENTKHELLTWIYFLLPLLLWFTLLYFFKTPIALNWEALSKIPDAITISIIIIVIFKKWIWHWSVWQGWLIKYPYLQGTWQGTLQTTWKNPETGIIPDPIPMILVIKQSFDNISCVMYTEESTSYSDAAMLSEDDSSGIQRINYTYMNNPDITIRGRSAIHHGAANLRIVKEGRKHSLTGEYWTSRNTSGNIFLVLRSKKLLGAFPKDLISKLEKDKKKIPKIRGGEN